MIVAALIVMAGIVLLAAGLRGRRIDDHPLCRRCRFDLVGVYGRADRCPECGSELSGPAAVRSGHRRIRPRVALAGTALLFAGIAAGGILGWASATGIDWNTRKPHWWLAAEARSSSPIAAAEFERRLRLSLLSRDRALEIVELALAHQLDDSLPWNPAWSDYLEQARRQGLLDAEQTQAYIRSLITPSFHMRPRMSQAMPWGMQVRIAPHRMGTSDLELRIESTGLWVDDRRIDDRLLRHATIGLAGMQSGSASFAYAGPRLMALPPGAYTMRVAVRLTVVDPLAEDATVGEWEQEFQSDLTIVPPGAPLVELIRDESLERPVRESISVGSTSITADGRTGEGALTIRDAPVDVLFDIYWRYPDPSDPEGYQEIRMGGIAAKAGTSSGSNYRRSIHADPHPGRIEIILRPAIGAAATRVEFDRIWGEEIILGDIEVSSP